MDLKAIAQAQLARIIAAHSGAVVSVVANGNTADAIRDSPTSEANLTDSGEIGTLSGRVFCNADTIGALTIGQAITVDDNQAFVLQAKTDPMGALMTISYQNQKPVEGIVDVL